MTFGDHEKILLDTNIVIYLTGSTTWKTNYDLPLVTHNSRDFEGIDGLNVITKYQIEQ